MILPDANILIYAHNPASDQYPTAKTWLEETFAATTMCLAWQTITAFVRISTNIRSFPDPYSLREAFDIVDSWLAQPNALIIEPSVKHLTILKALSIKTNSSGPKLMDANLAALAIDHGAVLATNDRDFLLFEGLKTINPLAKLKK